MTKMFPFIVKDMKNVLIYLPQALCACGIYAVCYGLVTLITGMLARRLQENGQQPTEETAVCRAGKWAAADRGKRRSAGESGIVRTAESVVKKCRTFSWKQSVCYLSVDACHDCVFLQRTGLPYGDRFSVYGNMGNNHAGSRLGH